jgi:hypothetical protein
MADTRVVPGAPPRRDDAFLRDGCRVCPGIDNSSAQPCWWVVEGHPLAVAAQCPCSPPPELWRRGRVCR